MFNIYLLLIDGSECLDISILSYFVTITTVYSCRSYHTTNPENTYLLCMEKHQCPAGLLEDWIRFSQTGKYDVICTYVVKILN